jgi:hypothetical protein
MASGAGDGSAFALADLDFHHFHHDEAAESDTRGGFALPVRHRVAGGVA